MAVNDYAPGDVLLAGDDAVHRHRGWFVALGVFMILLGIAAIAFPLIASLAVTMTVGTVLVVAGIAPGQSLEHFAVSPAPASRGTRRSVSIALAMTSGDGHGALGDCTRAVRYRQ